MDAETSVIPGAVLEGQLRPRTALTHVSAAASPPSTPFPAQAMELFQRATDATSRERDLCKAVPEPEAVITLVGTVKIQAAGAQKLKQAMQQKKKKK